jgi:hypothetical protein
MFLAGEKLRAFKYILVYLSVKVGNAPARKFVPRAGPGKNLRVVPWASFPCWRVTPWRSLGEFAKKHGLANSPVNDP